MNAGHLEGTYQAPTGSVAGKLRRSNWRPCGRRVLLSNVTADTLVRRSLQGFVLTVLCASASGQAPAPAPASTPAPITAPAAAPASTPASATAPAAPAAATPVEALPTPAQQL